MKLTIRPLTPELAQDYFAFFDDIAFSDHPEWSFCYCTFYHFDTELEKELNGSGKDGLRNYASQLVDGGAMNGYLAYGETGAVVGWCNAGPKNSFRRLRAEAGLWNPDDPAKIKSIVCFTIAPDKRRQGVATALLERVIADARADGYDTLEAYPMIGEHNCFLHYHGHEQMYARYGFEHHVEMGEWRALRLAL